MNGTIDKFPINTIFEYADSVQHGISPKLLSEVRKDINDCSVDDPVSERAIRYAVDDGSLHEGLYKNIGLGTPIYSHNEGISAQYYTLSSNSTDLNIYVDNDTVMLSGGLREYNNTLQDLSVQGGRYQYSNNISIPIVDASGVKIAYPNKNDVVGKIFIKCNEVPDNANSLYSIGITDGVIEDKNYFTKDFNITNNGLVKFEYSDSLSSEFLYIDNDSSEIRVYHKNSETSTVGNISVNIFYDEVVWDPKYGYDFGYENDHTIQRFNTDISNFASFNRCSLAEDHYARYGVIANSNYAYLYGGQNTQNGISYNTVSKFDKYNDTNNTLPLNSLPVSMYGMGTGKSGINAYILGGKTSVARLDTIYKMDFTNGTISTASSTLSEPKTLVCGMHSTTSLYYAGGHGPSETTYQDTIEKMPYNGTPSTISTKLSTGKSKVVAFNLDEFSILCCGKNATTLFKDIEVFRYSDDTMYNTTVSFTGTPTTSMNGFRNKHIGYVCYNDKVESYNYMNNVTQSINCTVFRNVSEKCSTISI
jgi:hypothetical protein